MLQKLVEDCFTKNQTRKNKGVSRSALLFRREIALKSDDAQSLKNEIIRLYSEGYGLKRLARDYLGISYTDTRSLFKFLDIEFSRGQNVVTDKLREFRRNKALTEHKDKNGWFDPNIRRKIESSDRRGVQGYYFNESLQKYVWLRSTYEYIFAKWLDKTKQKWDVECTHFDIDSKTYRPDFFLLNDENEYIKIVEIKGYWDNNSTKAKLLNERLKIPVVVILGLDGIKKFIESGSNYENELKSWKTVRKNGEDIKNQHRTE